MSDSFIVVIAGSMWWSRETFIQMHKVLSNFPIESLTLFVFTFEQNPMHRLNIKSKKENKYVDIPVVITHLF